MNTEIYQDVYPRLLSQFGFKENGDWLQQGTCPSCNKKELYARAESPWVLRCGRSNKCGEELHIKELYPDIFESFSDRYVSTPDNPTASADAFLSYARGLDVKGLKTLYTQENYVDPLTHQGSATIRFKVAQGAFWERLIDKTHRFDRKANFIGPYQGLVWSSPLADYSSAHEIWVTEGIFDALALMENGIIAVSILSCNNYPEKWLESLKASNPNVRLIIALDADKAGRKFTKKFVTRLQSESWQAFAAQPPSQLGKRKKVDWNDLHQLNRLTEKDLTEYRYYGDLLTAKTATAKAMVIHARKQTQLFQFDFENRLFQFKLDLDRFDKAMRNLETAEGDLTHQERVTRAMVESNCITEIANCKPTALYYQRNIITDESWYYFKVEFPSGEIMKSTFTGSQLSSSSEFKKRLLHIAKGALYTGNSQQLDRLMLNQLQQIKTVQTVDFLGYSKEFSTYVFRDLAVSNGKVYPLNDDDFFEVGDKSVKSLEQSVRVNINPELSEHEHVWPELLWEAFREKGLIALAYWFGSLFAEQIRDLNESYPFLEIVGEPASGKSTLIEFLWKLLGRDNWEGINPSTATLAARGRAIVQVSNMPVVFLEGDTDRDAKQKSMNWEEVKAMYNGRVVRARGMGTSGNETYEPPFRGALVISQNAVVDASRAVLERIVHLYTDKAHQNENTWIAAEKLAKLPVNALSGFLLKSTISEKQTLQIYQEQYVKYHTYLREETELKQTRIIKNHAQIMALLDALCSVVDLEDSWVDAALEKIVSMAIEREQAVQKDHPQLQEFWEVFEYLEANGCGLNHSTDANTIAFSLNQVYQVAIDWRQQLAPLGEMKKLLKSGATHKFMCVKTVRSGVNARHNRINKGTQKPEHVHCWVFVRGQES